MTGSLQRKGPGDHGTLTPEGEQRNRRGVRRTVKREDTVRSETRFGPEKSSLSEIPSTVSKERKSTVEIQLQHVERF